MVALALFTGALVGIAGLFQVAAKANRSSRATSLASALAAQKMEQLTALAWGYGPSGEERVDLRTDVASWPETQGGSGLTPSPAGALSSSTPGFVDYLDDQGAWIGTGLSVPPGASFVRRWSIRPLPASPLDTLVVRVVVVPRGRDGAFPPGGRVPFDAVHLTCVRSRRGT
jgi:hypothetical protein